MAENEDQELKELYKTVSMFSGLVTQPVKTPEEEKALEEVEKKRLGLIQEGKPKKRS